VSPAEGHEVIRRRYHPGPTMLETTWRTEGAEVVALDAMVSETRGRTLPANVIVRRVEARGVAVSIKVVLDPVRGRSQRPRWSRRAVVLVGTFGELALAVCDGGAGLAPGQPKRIVVEPGRPFTLTLTAAYRQPLNFVPPVAGWERSRTRSIGGGAGWPTSTTTGPTERRSYAA
jgi:hypothetical protein